MVILYTTHCPKCEILKRKLEANSIEFDIEENVESLIEKGFTTAPVLQVDEEFLEFGDAVKWLNNKTECKTQN